MKITLIERDRELAILEVYAEQGNNICSSCIIAQGIKRVFMTDNISFRLHQATINGKEYRLDGMGEYIAYLSEYKWSDLELPIDIELEEVN